MRHQLKINDRGAHTGTGQGDVDLENGKQTSQNQVKDEGKIEGSESRNGLSLEAEAEVCIWWRGEIGKACGCQRGKKAVVSKWVNEKQRKDIRKPNRNNDCKLLKASYLQTCFIRSTWTVHTSIMHFLYFKPASNCLQGFTCACPILETRVGHYHIKIQYATLLEH